MQPNAHADGASGPHEPGGSPHCSSVSAGVATEKEVGKMLARPRGGISFHSKRASSLWVVYSLLVRAILLQLFQEDSGGWDVAQLGDVVVTQLCFQMAPSDDYEGVCAASLDGSIEQRCGRSCRFCENRGHDERGMAAASRSTVPPKNAGLTCSISALLLGQHHNFVEFSTLNPRAAPRHSRLFAAARVVDTCREVINDFYFGLYEDEVDGEPVLTKADPEQNTTVQLEWAKYAQCVKYVRRDAFTAREYLESAPPTYSVALGRQYPVLLTPAKPDLSRYFVIPALDFVVGGFVKHSGVYDATEEHVLRRLIREEDCVVEIGSNIGSYTVILADEVGERGMVYAYEPFRKIFHILNANLALQGFGNVVTRQVGMSNVTQFVTVNAPDLNDYINLGAARVFHQQKEEIAHVHFDGQEEIEVESLDGLHQRGNIKCNSRRAHEKCRAEGASPPCVGELDVLKIDTEGMELEVVQGGLGLISTYWPVIYVESQPYFANGDTRFVDYMASVGYQCRPVQNLEMHEILLCIPAERAEYWNNRIREDFQGAR
eukprot:g2570.t1